MAETLEVRLEEAIEMLEKIYDGDMTNLFPKIERILEVVEDTRLELETAKEEVEKLNNELLELKFENGKRW